MVLTEVVQMKPFPDKSPLEVRITGDYGKLVKGTEFACEIC